MKILKIVNAVMSGEARLQDYVGGQIALAGCKTYQKFQVSGNDVWTAQLDAPSVCVVCGSDQLREVTNNIGSFEVCSKCDSRYRKL